MTNAEKIRIMASKDLDSLVNFINCPPFDCSDVCKDFDKGCSETCKHDCGKDYIRQWLNSEVW